MIRASMLATVLAVAMATGPYDDSAGPPLLTAQQKIAATEPLIRSATECIVRAVAANPHYRAERSAAIA